MRACAMNELSLSGFFCHSVTPRKKLKRMSLKVAGNEPAPPDHQAVILTT